VQRRRLTVKRIDPWSVLKFGAVVNLAMLAIGMLVFAVAWVVIDRLRIVDQICDIADTVGFQTCGVNAGNLFRALFLLGLLWVVIQTAVFVFLSFLHNLIADLTGGLSLTVLDDSPQPSARDQTDVSGTATARSAMPPAPPLRRDEAVIRKTTARPPVPPLGSDTVIRRSGGKPAGG
jgi:hypothetical protein